jgi:putative intracellular protease/amidase
MWKNAEKLSSFIGKAEDYDAIFFVGGHGPMFDLANNSTSHQIIREF